MYLTSTGTRFLAEEDFPREERHTKPYDLGTRALLPPPYNLHVIAYAFLPTNFNE